MPPSHKQAKALALNQELSVLLVKGAIEPVDLITARGILLDGLSRKEERSRTSPCLGLKGPQKILKGHGLAYAQHSRWSVNLKDAYFHVPIASHHRQLPFGLSLSSRVCGSSSLAPAVKWHEGPPISG